MKLLDMTRKPNGVFDGEVVTLDALWAEASSLGDVSVNDSIIRKGNQVSIKFERRSGSRVCATGQHTDILGAFQMAIAEARRLMEA